MSEVPYNLRISVQFDQISMTLMTTHVYTGDRDSPILKWYENVYTEMLTLLGAKEDTARQDAVDVVDFEVELAKILDPPEQKLNLARNYNNMTVGKMLDRYPQFDWRGLLQRYSSEANILITDDTEVVNMAVNYYDKLFPLIANTSTRTLLNYGMWKIAFTYASQSSSDVRNIKEPLLNALLGITKIPSRWRQCVEEMLVYFPEEMGRLYVESRGFTAGAKQKAEEIIENLRATFKQTLQATDWLTDSTKKAALEKLEYMSEKVGYPEYSMNDTWFDEQFENLNISDGTYLENTVNTVVFSRIQDTELLKKPLDKGRWVLSPASVNAFYSPQFNEMILPASILQAPFFDDMFPDVINYAAIGSVIGHEITHGYDFTGRGFDKYGNLASWWKMEDVEKFTDKAECIVLQYGNFSDPVLPLKVNGHTTLGENLADNRGVRESYRAYRKAIAQRGEEDGKLPALPYTPDQLFFIGYAQTWCGKFEDDYRQLLLLTDMHSPHRFRVNGVVQNNKDFARAFNCPKAAPMNPDKKCTVW
ncbi:hypothetical protein BaRGS_00038097 [Batillaria attramentaria]|uniref:Uncharacterized protein n=1 Tax=Batillaria attramentaria TaxID=370345 RepID=A0ABD0J6T3_9CAEN